jgi:hypothetical protein
MIEAAGRAARVLAGQLESDNPWLAQNAATRVLNHVQSIEQQNDKAITVTFAMGVKPGMPDAASLPETAETVIRADGEVV